MKTCGGNNSNQMPLQDVTSKYANKSEDERYLIVQVGFMLRERLKLCGRKTDVKYMEIVRELKNEYDMKVDYRCVKQWWDRRNEVTGEFPQIPPFDSHTKNICS